MHTLLPRPYSQSRSHRHLLISVGAEKCVRNDKIEPDEIEILCKYRSYII